MVLKSLRVSNFVMLVLYLKVMELRSEESYHDSLTAF